MKKKFFKKYMISFDNDGTLTDTHPIWDKIHAASAEKLGVYYEPGLGSKMYLKTAPHVWGKNLEEQYKFYHEEFEKASIVAWREQKWMDSIQMFSGMREVVTWLYNMGYRMAIVTSSTAARAENPMRRNGIIQMFDDIISCEDRNLPDKPSPEALRLLSENNQVDPEKIIHIGDTKYDIGMAHAFGALSIGIGYGGYTKPGDITGARPAATANILTVDEIKYIPAMIETLIKYGGRKR